MAKIMISNEVKNRFPEITKEIAKWSNRDFLIYYAQKQQSFTNIEFKIPRVAWIGFLSRMKGFRGGRNIDNSAYKTFIDELFNLFYSKGFSPAFGSIVSIKLYGIVKSYRTKKYSNVEFERLKAQLYRDSSLFKNLAAAFADVVI